LDKRIDRLNKYIRSQADGLKSHVELMQSNLEHVSSGMSKVAFSSQRIYARVDRLGRTEREAQLRIESVKSHVEDLRLTQKSTVERVTALDATVKTRLLDIVSQQQNLVRCDTQGR
jgi:hypothetical protein